MTEPTTIRPSAPAGAAAASPDLRLSEARLAQNLTTADVARRLKLSVWQIEALESGDYHRLPGPIFVRGFIRNYARLLKLDPEELLQAVAGLLPETVRPPETPRSRDIPFPGARARPWPKFAAAGAAIVVALALYEFYFNDEHSTFSVRTDAAASLQSSPSPQSAPAPSRKPKETPAKPAVAMTSAQQGTRAAPAADAAPRARERISHPDEREVRLVFEEDSWVEIRDRDGETIFFQLNAAGTTRRVAGVPPLSVVVGNSQGVKMTYAGQPVDLARHTKIDVARLTLE